MKKFVCLLLVVAICALSAVGLAGCKRSALDEAVKNGDNYTIACALDDKAMILSAVQTVEMTNRSENSFDAVKLHLFANAYREGAAWGVVPNTYTAIAYPNGESFGHIDIDSAKVNGQSAPFVVEGTDSDILSVPTGSTWYPNQKLTLELTYQVQLANIRHRLGWTENGVNLGNFFPIVCAVENGQYCCTPYYNIGDPFVSECANFDVTLKIAEGYVVASTGNLLEASGENGFVTYHYTAEATRDFAFVCSKNFKKLSQTVDGVSVNYYYFADAECENSLATAVGALQYYTQNIGEYPYKQISVCETEFCYGGMEYPSLVMVTSGQTAYQEAIAHEVAHQWFYAVVGNNQIETPWVDEGLAEFLTYLYLDSTGIVPLAKNMLAATRTYTTYVDVLNNYYHDVDTAFRSVDKYKNDSEYVVMTYVKGCLLFHTVYEAMGATKFWRALGDFYSEGAFATAPSALLVQCFADIGGQEIATIFATFCEGKEIIGRVTD